MANGFQGALAAMNLFRTAVRTFAGMDGVDGNDESGAE